MLKIIFASALTIFSWAYANESTEVVVDSKHSIPTLGPQWSDTTKSNLYYSEPAYDIAERIRAIGYQTPISVIEAALEKATSNFSKKAPAIAKECKRLNPDQVWAQISCAARSVKKTFKEYKWPGLSTSCRAHAEAFKEVFQELNIPRSNVGKLAASMKLGPHVVNRITLTDQEGKTHNYVIDAGIYPDHVFPLVNTGSKELPDIKFKDPIYSFHPTKEQCDKPNQDRNIKEILKALTKNSQSL